MVATTGLAGLRPHPTSVAAVVSPPYDIIKPGSSLEGLLKQRPESLYHVILGDDPAAELDRLRQAGHLVADDEPCYYVLEQVWEGGRRLGVFAAVACTPYAAGGIRRHEKTFDDKVAGRIALAKATGLTLGPIFLLTRRPLDDLLRGCLERAAPLYDFTCDFGGHGDLHGITHRVVRVAGDSADGRAIAGVLGADDLYIADGHHRYHAALIGGQTHALAYVTGGATILAYDRLVNGTVPFAAIMDDLPLRPTAAFATPPRHAFAIYHAGRSWLLPAREVPEDVVGRLDCAILERELYPRLGLTRDHIADPAHFDYLPESELGAMQAQVDAGRFDLAVALAPVTVEDLMAVADAGLEDPTVVMPEKSTFFAPKIPSGLIAYHHRYR